MSHSMRAEQRSVPVLDTDELRPTPAKAGLRPDHHRTGQDQPGPSFNAAVRDAVVRHYGSVKAAAISLDVDPSLMNREFDHGKFARLEQMDEQAKAAIAKQLYEQFGAALEDPKLRAKRVIREARAKLDELDQYVEQAS